ncbi:hypothetical protein O6H91_11G067100 [Diphasiastrum complanatum]|uniref:Uncharacterized protein n=1 Tax=Diphasiastrum complanatum TaxID=34168 RepID=A0ACC2CA45_DIPCM|nr:hypothetical protein O6H91_11G067100 [Diphasiastrum complanatum]
MGIILDEPKHPVIDANPSFGKTVSNFSMLDYLKITTITGVSLPFGYLAGASSHIRGPSMYTAGIIGLMGGFMYAYQNSAGRLMGMLPNNDDIARHRR